MRNELIALRKKMKANGFDAYMIPTSDFHQSEYVHDHFKCREFISGFTGSAGTLVVTMDEALLWTDGRYFLQAASQLEGSGISLMKMGQEGVPTVVEYLESVLDANGSGDPESSGEAKILAFDGRVCTPKDIPEGKFNMVTECDLVGEIWPDRPVIEPSEIYELPESVTGESHESKLSRLRAVMTSKDADCCILSALDEIAWLYNLRGDDVKHTPVFFAYALITADEDVLYVMDETFDGKDKDSTITSPLRSMTIRPYVNFLDDIMTLPEGKLLIDRENTSYAILDALPEDVEIISCESPVAAMKAIKNECEIHSTKKAHLKDGTAMVEFLCWLKSEMTARSSHDSGNNETEASTASLITELSAAGKLEGFRRKQDGFNDLSFETISAYGANGAIVHYSATEETNKILKPEGFYLVDSGGQYDDGTTDITRTIALGPLTDEMKLHYTTVLKSHIALCTAKFEPGTTGAALDELTRAPLRKIGLDYNHGTGHGVGHLLGCHEGPQSISPRDKTHAIVPGMINSDEPGVYIEGEYGIRLENELLCIDLCNERSKQAVDTTSTDRTASYGFEPITFCPFDIDAIAPVLMTDDELAWLNEYHRQVYEKISPLVSEDARIWLAGVTIELKKSTKDC